MTEHISDLRWDQLIAGDLAAELADAARTHAAACERCGARLAELDADAKQFDIPLRAQLEIPRRRRSRAPWIAGGAALAMAAAIFLLVRTREPQGERTKGRGAQLVLVGGPQLAALANGDRIAPGDSLQAVYSAKRDGFGAVIARDRTGVPSAYVPSAGTHMVALPAGDSLSFPQSTIADATLGDETIIILWCETARPMQPLLDELRARGTVTAPEGCAKHQVTIDKR